MEILIAFILIIISGGSIYIGIKLIELHERLEEYKIKRKMFIDKIKGSK